MSELVVKDNALINASYSLSLVEQRLILLAIVATRKDDHDCAWDFWLGKPIKVTAQSYMDTFGVSRQTAYEVLKDACKTLFSRQFSYQEPRSKGTILKTTRWVSDIAYNNDTSTVEFTFAPAVLPLVTRLEAHLTSYELQQIADLKSGYAVRLYELLISWRATGKTPIIKLEELRNKLGVGKDEYLRMDNFKRIVLNPAIEQVSEHTNIKAVYEQHKKGRVIEGFSFAFKTKKKAVDKGERDPNTADMFTKLTDKQLARIVHSKKFINDYNGLVSAQNPANQSSGAWVAHMVEWLKKDPSNFAKRPMQEYLDDEQAQRF
jgi:plasmid replication initiation protein